MDEKIIEIPIFKAEKLNEVELKCLKYINKNSMFLVNDLAKHLECSTTHAYRIISKLTDEKYISKEDRYEVLIKGKLVII